MPKKYSRLGRKATIEDNRHLHDNDVEVDLLANEDTELAND